MNKISILFIACVVSSCGKPASIDTVESLLANPERLKEVQRLCKEDHAKAGDATCNAAAEALRQRFMGDGKANYTPSMQ